MAIEVNKYQTPLTDEFLRSLHEEVRDDLLSFISGVEFISNLISPKRQRAKDRPRDKYGRIIVDLCNPHILEDMDYFRPTALHYQEKGTLTDLTPNSNPRSDFGRWFAEEINRCWNGYVRPSDGEWIPGDMYFYLNYCPIIQSVTDPETHVTDRIEDFPLVWEGVYLRAHYHYQARYGGLYNNNRVGQHAFEIAKRGMSKSYYCAAMVAKCFIVGLNSKSYRNTRSTIYATDKEKLIKDGILNKFVSIVDFCATHTQFPTMRIVDSMDKMTWTMGYKDLDTMANKGTNNTVLGVAIGDKEGKGRGKRCNIQIYEEIGEFPNFLETYGTNRRSVEEGSKAFGISIGVGTGGSKQSNFSGCLELIYNPIGYNVYGLPNVFDRNSQSGKKCILFLGAYLNRAGCMNKDGVSDVTKALVEILEERRMVKYNSSDANTLNRVIAEDPITIQEAILRKESSWYPIPALMEHLNEIDTKPGFYDTVYVGGLVQDDNGEVKPVTGPEYQSIREFPHKDNKLPGAIEFYQMPVKDSNGKVMRGRYIAGCLTPGEKIITGEGLKSVEDVTLNDKLVNENGKLVPVKTLLRYDVCDEDTYRIKVANTIRTTNFTKEHPILVSKNKLGYVSFKKYRREGVSQRYHKFDFKYKKAEEIEAGDWIKVPNIYKNTNLNDIDSHWDESKSRIDRVVGSPLRNPEFWWFVGTWIGDGWCESDKYRISVTFNSKEILFIDRFKAIVNSLFNRAVNTRKRQGSVELSFSFQCLSAFLTNNFGKYASGKNIPEWVKYLPNEYKLALIQGYLDSDGCISETKESYHTYFTSINSQLLEAIQDILFSLGIISGLKMLRDKSSCLINGKISLTKKCYELSIAHHHTIKLYNLLSAYIEKDHKLGKVDTCKYIKRRRPEGDCFFDEQENFIYFQVKKIEKGNYTGIVYNFECETHTFMCPHITTHNCDPFDDDSSDTLSLGSIHVLDLFTDEIVAEYTGRRDFADEFYEICRLLLLFYNAEASYENNKKGLFAYFSKMNCLYLLSDVLDFLKEKDPQKEYYGNKSKGLQSTEPIKKYGRQCIRDWLNSPVTRIVGEGEGETEITYPKLKTLKSRALIKELINWDPNGNYDRHDALIQLMLLRVDKVRLAHGDIEGKTKNDDPSNRKDDKFFSNYDSVLKKKKKVMDPSFKEK